MAAKKTCFIAMPLTTTEEVAALNHGDRDHFVHVLDHLFVPAVEAAGFEAIKPIMSGGDVIQGQIIKHLETADLVLCDISGHNPNVFFELGIRTALDRPVALVRDDKTLKLPFDTSIVNTHTYGSALVPWTMKKELESLTRHILDTERNTPSTNALWGFFGLTKRAAERLPTQNPLEAKVDVLMAQMAQIAAETGRGQKHDTAAIRSAADDIYAVAMKHGVVISSLNTNEDGIDVFFEEEELPNELLHELAKVHKLGRLDIHLKGASTARR